MDPPSIVGAALSPKRLQLILMPTEACNFRCTYCYEEFAHGRMRPDVVSGVKELLVRRAPDLHDLGLSWFGGEPLLAVDIVEDIMKHAQSLARRHSHLQVESDMTTNAFTLTPTVFERLLSLGVRKYQITFDGPRRTHDQTRLRINGGPSFDRLWSNLLAMRQVEGRFEILVRLHVQHSNHSSLQEFLDDYAREFGDDPRFTVFFRLLGRFGGQNDASLPVMDEREGELAIAGLRAGARAKGLPTHAPEGSMCYAAFGNSFLVRADGRINKCTLALEHPNNQVGRIHEDGRIEIAGERLKYWMRGVFSGDSKEMTCPMLGFAEVNSPAIDTSAALRPMA